MIETKNATTIPVNKSVNSMLVKSKPNLNNFKALAPNIMGMDKKNEYSAATKRDVPTMIAPKMVAPERDVHGISAKHWNIPIIKAVLYDNPEKLVMVAFLSLFRFSIQIIKTP